VPKDDVCRCRGRALLGQNSEGGRRGVPHVRDVPPELIFRNHRFGDVVGAGTSLAQVLGCRGGRGDAQQPLAVGGDSPICCVRQGWHRTVGAGGKW